MARKRKGDTEGGKPPDGDEKEPARLGNPDADPVRIHREYVERRVSGGAEATPEAYARALKQWHQLPGAVSAPPTEMTGEDAPPISEESEDEEEMEAQDAGREEERPA
jgi:hypothetical protein